MKNQINFDITLEEIFEYFDKNAHESACQVHYNENGNRVGKVTPKSLRNGISPLITEIEIINKDCPVHIYLYENGFCTYAAEGRKTVVDLFECACYDYKFEKLIDGTPDHINIDHDKLMSMKWYHVATLFGEDRIGENLMNEIASRRGTNANEITNVDDDGDYMGVPDTIADFRAIDPEEAAYFSQIKDDLKTILTEKQYNVIELTFLKGMTHEEAAMVLGYKNRNNVTQMVKIALNQIRDYSQKTGYTFL